MDEIDAMYRPIKQEHPRDKLSARGIHVLSDSELLTVLLGRRALAQELLQHYQSVRALLQTPEDTICQHAGMGRAQFARLHAALELARRCWAEELTKTSALKNTQCTRRYLSACLSNMQRELFGVLLLDTQHRVIHFEILFKGTVNATAVYPREIVRLALTHNASAVIIAHNHPSGCPEPSAADQQVTEHIAKALELMCIALLDHVILGAGAYVSFAERGWLCQGNEA